MVRLRTTAAAVVVQEDISKTAGMVGRPGTPSQAPTATAGLEVEVQIMQRPVGVLTGGTTSREAYRMMYLAARRGRESTPTTVRVPTPFFRPKVDSPSPRSSPGPLVFGRRSRSGGGTLEASTLAKAVTQMLEVVSREEALLVKTMAHSVTGKDMEGPGVLFITQVQNAFAASRPLLPVPADQDFLANNFMLGYNPITYEILASTTTIQMILPDGQPVVATGALEQEQEGNQIVNAYSLSLTNYVPNSETLGSTLAVGATGPGSANAVWVTNSENGIVSAAVQTTPEIDAECVVAGSTETYLLSQGLGVTGHTSTGVQRLDSYGANLLGTLGFGPVGAVAASGAGEPSVYVNMPSSHGATGQVLEVSSGQGTKESPHELVWAANSESAFVSQQQFMGAAGTVDVPPGATTARITLTGGGGGGRNPAIPSSTNGGGGGGGGATIIVDVAVGNGSTVSISIDPIGSGGAAGTNDDPSGASTPQGGTSTKITLTNAVSSAGRASETPATYVLTARGGDGALNGQNYTGGGAGGQWESTKDGTGTFLNWVKFPNALYLRGGGGGAGILNSSPTPGVGISIEGMGGCSYWGGGNNGDDGSSNDPCYGSGGGGGGLNQYPANKGGNGAVFIEWF